MSTVLTIDGTIAYLAGSSVSRINAVNGSILNQTVLGPLIGITSIALSNDNNYLYIGLGDGQILLWQQQGV